MANILVIRLSAIGDVAMTVPVIYSAAKANPTDSFTVLTQAFLIPVFINRPKNVNVIGINTKSTEKTLAGLLRFASALVKYDFDLDPNTCNARDLTSDSGHLHTRTIVFPS